VLTRAPDREFRLDIDARGRPERDGRSSRPRSSCGKTRSERDPLTALYDRPAFQALLEREIARARRAGEPLALLMLDVDRLTTLNARISHLAADGVLAQIAAERRLRPSGPPCRVAGGRFGVLVSDGDGRDAERLFERLQAMLRERPLPDVGTVTVSGGIAELLATDDSAALVVRADAALGLAKGSGRDTVVTAARR
jgi:diguanylate cyclase (GGDEF)-like protein